MRWLDAIYLDANLVQLLTRLGGIANVKILDEFHATRMAFRLVDVAKIFQHRLKIITL
jgi:hypothetical protein